MQQHRTATISKSWLAIAIVLVLSFCIAWVIRHIVQLASPHQLTDTNLAFIWFVSFASLAWTNVLALLERPYKVTEKQNKLLDKLNVVVLIPAYNEDAPLLRGCIQSMLDQTRLPDTVVIVDDGSTADYTEVKEWLYNIKDELLVNVIWQRTANGGKRHAQATGIRLTPEAQIYVTVDSDTVLDPRAIEEGLKPFIDRRVSSVAGLCLPINVNENLLTRFTGLWETMWQLVDRSSQSTMGCVTVNTGQLAFYKATIIRRYLDAYLSETFFGRPVGFSDDSLMTLYSMMHGRTIQQTTSLSFSAVPNKYSHHIRRYMRWMRGSFIRSWWRTKYLPFWSYINFLHMWRWFTFIISTLVTLYLTYTGVLYKPEILLYLVSVPVFISYMQSLRYMTIVRNDESKLQRFVTFLTAPIAMLWMLTVLRVVKWYAYATCLNTGWGTRQKAVPEVSVTL